MKAPSLQRVAAWLGPLLALAALLAVYLAYQNPHLAVALANRLWSCF